MKVSRRAIKRYARYFDDIALMDKIKTVAGQAGSVVVYYALILYYLLSDKTVPNKNKLIMVAALGYFILPADLITDVIPGLGFTDDITFLSYAISTAMDYITPELKEKARRKLDSSRHPTEIEEA